MGKSTRRIGGLTILVDPNHCPACRQNKAFSHDTRRCRFCGTYLFKPDDNFNAVARSCLFDGGDGITAFWVYFPLDSVSKSRRGWVHSDHLEKPKPHLDPTAYEARELKPNLGRPKDPRVRFTGDRAAQYE